jgi:uncharacterized protein YlxP (DUF503 family)
MGATAIGLLHLYLFIPGCSSLKEKRSRVKPLVLRLQREFNLSVAEIDHQDLWQNAVIGCVMISGDAVHARRNLSKVIHWVERYWPDVDVVDDQIEIFTS